MLRLLRLTGLLLYLLLVTGACQPIQPTTARVALNPVPTLLHSGLHTLFLNCTADAACHAAYPALEQHFYALLDRLHEAPVTVSMTAAGRTQQVVVNDLKFLQYLFSQLQLGILSPLPRQIEAIFAGNYEAPAARWLAYAATQATPASRLTGATAYGIYYSTLCNYAAGVSTVAPQPVSCALCTEAHVRHPSLVAYADFMLSGCAFWQAGTAPARLVSALAPVDIPTLLLTGAYDCALPPYLTQGLATTLPNSYHFVLPVGHTVVRSLCGLYLTDQFLTDPTVRPNTACIAGMKVEWSTL